MGWKHVAAGASDFVAAFVAPNFSIILSIYFFDYADFVETVRSRVHGDAIVIDTSFL